MGGEPLRQRILDGASRADYLSVSHALRPIEAIRPIGGAVRPGQRKTECLRFFFRRVELLLEKTRVERHLAAIFAADVAGYSRLMGADEVGTLARLRIHRHELLDPAIEMHRGHIANTAGDSILAEFGSVADAVTCAVEIQRRMLARNSAIPPDQRIEFRIGINERSRLDDVDHHRRRQHRDAPRPDKGGGMLGPDQEL
jgi:hypothetical protein